MTAWRLVVLAGAASAALAVGGCKEQQQTAAQRWEVFRANCGVAGFTLEQCVFLAYVHDRGGHMSDRSANIKKGSPL